jgi:hypothetical protein
VRIVAIDGGALRGSRVSTTVEAAAAAAEDGGAVVLRRRLFDRFTRCQVGRLDRPTARTSDDPLDDIVADILTADGVVFGTSAASLRPNLVTASLLERLSARFAGNCLAREAHGRVARLRPGRRLVVITATPPYGRIVPLLGKCGPGACVRQVFARADVRALGDLVVVERHAIAPPADDGEERAALLGARLAEQLAEEVERRGVLTHPALTRRRLAL